jgi:glutamate synthase domain-containing protein 2
MESAEDLVLQGVITGITPEKAVKNLIKSLGKGVLKVMSKMGISTIASYTGAQVFEAIGLSQEVVDEYFVGTTSRLGGVSLDVIAEETIARHHIAYPPGNTSGVAKVSLTYLIQRLSLLCNIQLATSVMTCSSATPIESMSRASA